MFKLLIKLFKGDAANNVARYIAIKAVLVTLTLVVLPIILFNFKIEIAEYAFTFITSFISIDLGTIAFTGIGGWLINTFNLIPAMAIILLAYVDRIILKLLINVF